MIDGATYLVSPDHLGTPRSLQRATNGAEVWRWDGEPFGASHPAPAQVAYNLRFAGQLYDAQTGYHCNWMRDYNPVTGRYLQPDPIGLEGGLSRYAYVGGNPISFVDPEGLLAPPVNAVIGFAVGAGANVIGSLAAGSPVSIEGAFYAGLGGAWVGATYGGASAVTVFGGVLQRLLSIGGDVGITAGLNSIDVADLLGVGKEKPKTCR